MDLHALQLGSRFALGPNQLGYCGHGSAPEKFKDCVIRGNSKGVSPEFRNFIVLTPYLKTLSAITHQSFLSYPVFEAYWLGNSQLKKAQPYHYPLLMDNFAKQGVPPWLITELRSKTPKEFIPFHLFQILHVGVGRASSAVPFNLKSINNCMIRWGPVLSVNPQRQTLKVNLASLKKDKSGRYLLTRLTETASYLPGFLPHPKAGQTVAVHWGTAAKVLTAREEKNLSYWTGRVLRPVT